MTRTRTRGLGFLLTIFAAAIAALAFAGSALAEADEGTGTSSAPSISSDKADYHPGELVTLRGSNWAPGESVRIVVDDDGLQPENPWQRDVTVTADGDGNVIDQFNLPNWFVADYRVTASGATSGTAMHSFTDSNPQEINIDPTSVTVTQGATASYTVTLQVGGNSQPCTVTFSTSGLPAGASPTFVGGASETTTGADVVKTLQIATTASTATGTHAFTVSSANSGSGCQGPGAVPGDATLVVNAANTAPVAQAQSVSTDEDTAKTITLTGSDPDGNALTFSIVSGPSNGTLGSIGTVTCSGTPSACSANVTYTPGANYHGPDSFTFKVNDGTVDSPAAMVSITVNPVNDAPTCSAVTITTDEDTQGSAAANCADVDGDTLSYEIVDDATNGSASVSGGDLLYDPDPNFNGTDSFTYRASDGTAFSAAADADVTVNPVNDAPTVAADNASVTVDEGSTAANTGTFDDVDLDDSAPDTVTISASVGTVTQDDSARTWSWSLGTSDGPDDSQTVTITATDDAGETAQTTFDLTVRNVRPTADLDGPASANEGETKAYTYTFTDPGADSWTHAVSCGDNGNVSDDVFTPATKSGSFKCTWSDNHASQIVSAKVEDDDGAQHTDTIDVAIANVAPTASLANDGPVDEGSPATIAFSDQSDPSSADTTAGFRYAYRCDGNASLLPTTYAGAGASDSTTCVFGDNGSKVVRARIFDKDNGFRTYETTVEVNNVAPTASNPFFELNPVTGVATARFDYTDAGWLDTHLGSYFNWSIDPAGTNRLAAITDAESSPPDATGKASDIRTLVPGCYSLTVTGTARDDDGATSAPLTIFSGSATPVLEKSFRPPIMDNERNIAKYGNVVPVKFVLTNTCTGATTTSATLHIQVVKGIVLEGDPDPVDGENPVTESVSNADSGTMMRVVDGQYMYNLGTKSYTANTDYTIRVRYGSSAGPIIARAFLYPKK